MVDLSHYRIAILIPCYNEEITIASIVSNFRAHLHSADIYVFNNNSSDNSIAMARQAGAFVREIFLQGKGNVVQRMFADTEVVIYIMVDGDDTYDASAAPALTKKLVASGLDMLVGSRVSEERKRIG